MPARHPQAAVITGMGCVCAAGVQPDSVLDAMQGPAQLSPPHLLGEQTLPFPFFAVDESLFAGGRRFSALDTLTLAQHAATAALEQARLPWQALQRMGVMVGTTAGSALHFLQDYAASRRDKIAVAPPLSPAQRKRGCVLSDKDDYLAANLALALLPQSRGPRLTLTNACTSGADALGLALAALRQGADCVLCGGADALSMVPHTGFARLMIYADGPCRPFDRDRKGLNLGEAAAMLVLESEEHAAQRGARILGRVLGYGAAADAHHFTAPHPQGRGLLKALGQALGQDLETTAHIDMPGLAFVNAHATATPENDKVEGGLLCRVAPHLPVWASKGATGHTLGAAGALEAVLAVQALRRGILPMSPGFAHADPEIGLVPTTSLTRLPAHQDKALSTSLGFGGGNAALLLQGERA